MSLKEAADKAHAALNRLTKWRQVFASWQLGSRTAEDGECRAVRDHREVTILLRAEVNALVALMVKAKVFAVEEFNEALAAEADQLSKDYEKAFPGYRATDVGMNMDMPVVMQTIKKLNFPP